MSEELIQRGLLKKGIEMVEFEYFNTHSTTLKQYKENKIIPNKSYGEYEKRKPDGLLIDRRNKTNPRIIAVIEYKKPSDFQTDKQKKDAIEQCNDLCQVLNSSIGIITDGIVTFWINPKSNSLDNNYFDRTTNEARSYSFILKENKQILSKKFFLLEKNAKKYNELDDETRDTYDLINKILNDITPTNNILSKVGEIDPLYLATNVWQDIYVNTGKDPTKCLYNVVELFIFKFLSDLEVLQYPNNFNNLIEMYERGATNKEVLSHYARNCRQKIRTLFPKGIDNTTVINGTIFVDKDGNPVESQANLFKNSLFKYRDFGCLKHIKKEFKTKLFETFLKQSQDKSRLGQFFTPRKIVNAIVEMADIENAKFICDPFCGVGGFVLEPLQFSNLIKKEYSPKNNKINPKIKLLGYDKGNDEDDERTIILAKANMLIYLSDIVEKHPTLTDEYSKIINDSFKLLSKSNLGTLSEKFDKDENKPDLILSNPPYVKKGSGSLRKEIIEEGLEKDFINSGQGVEGLALKWILDNLQTKGKAFIIIPNSIMDNFGNKNIRDEIIKYCYINCIISLPVKTFFNTPKKTYILGITKKNSFDEKQTNPIFTYIVSNIGETLDSYRFEIPGKSDLEKAKDLFNQFKGSPNSFVSDDKRCKIISFNDFEKSDYWIIENWWSKREKINLGIQKEEKKASLEEYDNLMLELIESIKSSRDEIKTIEKEIKQFDFKEVDLLGDDGIFDAFLGNAKYTKTYIQNNLGEYPVYSGQTTNNGECGKTNSYDYEIEGLTWTIDGYPGRVFYRNEKFSMTTHCGLLVLKDKLKQNLSYEYLYYVLNNHLPNFAVGEGNKRLKKTHIERDVKPIKIPIKENGNFDLQKQIEIAEKYRKIENIKKILSIEYESLKNLNIDISR